MALAGEPLEKMCARVARGDVPPILITRFDADAGEDLYGRDRLVRDIARAVLADLPPRAGARRGSAARAGAPGGSAARGDGGESRPGGEKLRGGAGMPGVADPRAEAGEAFPQAGDESWVFGRTIFDGPTVALAEVLDAAREVSLLTPKRLVLVRGSRLVAGAEEAAETSEAESEGAPSPAERAAPGGDDAQIAYLGRYLKGVSRSACIVFVGCPWDGRRRIHKALLAAATVVDTTRPDLRQMPSWIEGRVGEAGGRIDPEASSALAELRGNDTLRLGSEITKLLLHAGRARAITRADVALLVGAAEATSAWALVDGLADGDADRAVAILRRLLREGEAVPAIVGAIASRLRQLVVLCDERSSGRPHEAARKVVFPGRSIYFADGLARKAGRFSPRALLGALATLYNVDRQTKSSSIEGGALLEEWLLSVLKSSGFVRS